MRTAVSYGSAADQVGDLYLPDASRAPLICLFHGGFWRMPYGRDQLDGMAEDLRSAGVAVWNLGYRRVGDGGSPWPATLTDVESAIHHLPALQREHPVIDLDRVVLAGHSAGGHLAFWGASRFAYASHTIRPAAAVGLAPMLDLDAAALANLGNGAVQQFLGGTAADVPERYNSASPAALLPIGVRQWVLHGTNDAAVPCSLSEAYCAKAAAVGDSVRYVALPDTDHMMLIDPTTRAYQEVRRCLLEAAQ